MAHVSTVSPRERGKTHGNHFARTVAIFKSLRVQCTNPRPLSAFIAACHSRLDPQRRKATFNANPMFALLSAISDRCSAANIRQPPNSLRVFVSNRTDGLHLRVYDFYLRQPQVCGRRSL